MSLLIEDNLFQTKISVSNGSRQFSNIFSKKKSNFHNVSRSQIPLSSSNNLFSNPKTCLHLDESFTFKSENFSMVLMKKFKNSKRYKFEGIILEKDEKFTIKFKQKRIYFGKEWMKQKVQSPIKVQLNFSNGQLTLTWPQIFESCNQSSPNSKFGSNKIEETVLIQIINFFQKAFIPTLKKVLYNQSTEILFSDQRQYGTLNTSNESMETNATRLQKYLQICTTFDDFQEEKQSYKKQQERLTKKNQSIFKVQSNLDFSFNKIGPQINLYFNDPLGKAKKRLSKIGFFQSEERKAIENYIRKETCKNSNLNQAQYIYNCIGILKVQNKKKFISSGGTCNIFMTKIVFQYIYSNDSNFWIEENKKNVQNASQKYFVIKEPKKTLEAKLRHQDQIVRQIRGGHSIYLPKYYKILNVQKNINMDVADLMIMDFLKGETLDMFAKIHRDYLSFWTKIFLIRNISNGLRFLQSYKIVHLDLKPDNLIVTCDLMTKIIDFSESYHSHVCTQDFQPGLSLPYSAPEMLEKNKKVYDAKCDVFSLGVVMFELFMGSKLMQIPKEKIFTIYFSKDYMKRIILCPQLTNDENISPIFNVILNLTMKCLDPNPENRPTLNWISIICNQVLESFKSG